MRVFWKCLLLVLAMGVLIAQVSGKAFGRTPPKPATEATLAANASVYQQLPFADTQDFEDAQQGFIGRPETLTIRDDTGKPVWDLESYKQFITLEAEAPDTVNPSLWRITQLNMLYGLFQVTDRIYQVRGYDISNITFIRGDTGWIVMDPLVTTETARAALELVTEHLGERPITGIIYSHPHVDHYGGARGIVDEAAAARIPIVAPEGFLEHAIRENVIAGNAMSRRAMYMFGPFLPRNARGGVGSGLGMTISSGSQSLIPPTISIGTTGEELIIDGVRMVFQMTPDTEAPVEMNTWFPDQKAMWMAENITATMHNILTLRGAQVRDALGWAWYLNEAIELFGSEMEVVFQSHHWPVWGNARAVDKLRKHRDIYKYMHDQTINLMNKGYTGEEIAEMLELPEELERNWSTRGNYGTLRHNVRAIYQRYMGWYDGNPANLNNLPPVQAARKYVEYMGGEAAIVQRARADYDQGEYRWVAEVLKHVVFTNPDNHEARELQADAFEQMGYQAESGPWRSVYLQAALELRDGIPNIPGRSGTFSPDVIRAMTPDMLFDYMAVRLNGPKAAGRTIRMNITLTGLPREVQAAYGLTVENAVLNYGQPLEAPDAVLTLDKSTLAAIALGHMTMEQALDQGLLILAGHPEAFSQFMSLLDTFAPLFPIVTPRDKDDSFSSYTIDFSAGTGMGGTVSGAGRYTAGRTITVTAVPNPGFKFKGWMENGNIVSTSAAYQITVNRNQTFTPVFTPLPSPGNESGVDYNNDDKADLLLFDKESLKVLLGFINGLELADGGFLTTLPEGWIIKGSGYFGGQAGIIVRHDEDEQLLMYLIDGLQVTDQKDIGVISHEFKLLFVADINGSRDWDLIFKHLETRDIYTVYMDGHSPVAFDYLGRLDENMDIILPADLTGDQKSELILRNMQTGELFMAVAGDEGWAKNLIADLPLDYELVNRGFFNQDRKADLIFRNADNHELWVVYMDGSVPTGVDFAGHIPVAEWKLVTVADYNGNGLSDTLWMHVPTRTLVIALTGDHLFSEVGPLFELPDEWEVKQ